MRDVTEQLTTYFDSTVERVTAEDVLAGSDVGSQDGGLEPSRTPRLRPAWVVAAGFVATIVFIGGAVGVVRALRSGSTEVGSGQAPISDGGLSFPAESWIAIGAVLLLSVVGLAVRTRGKVTKEKAMQTLERPEAEVSPEPRSPALLILLAALLVLAAGALGWWSGSSGDNGTADAPEIVDRVVQAYVDGDPEAVAAAYADDAIFEEKELEELVLNRDGSLTGRSVIRGHTETGFQYADIDEMTVDMVMEVDDLIVFKWTALGASAPSPGAAERFPFETTGVMVFEMAEDGLIGRSFLYYDSDEYFNVGTS